MQGDTSLGAIRKIDELGRINLPKEILRKLNLNQSDEVKVYISKSKVVLEKIKITCFCCNSEDNLKQIKSKYICISCINYLKELK